MGTLLLHTCAGRTQVGRQLQQGLPPELSFSESPKAVGGAVRRIGGHFVGGRKALNLIGCTPKNRRLWQNKAKLGF